MAGTRAYRDAYRRYCWAVPASDYRLAPFHLLASEGRSISIRRIAGTWRFCNRLAAADPGFPRRHFWRSISSQAAVEAASQWWVVLPRRAEAVVKPSIYRTRSKGLVQPALKCRAASTPHHLAALSTRRTISYRTAVAQRPGQTLARRANSRWGGGAGPAVARQPLRRARMRVRRAGARKAPVDP